HYNLLTEILRNEWGFDGFVMTDWYSIGAVYGQNAGQSVQGWLNYAGNDCEMPGNNVPNVLAALEDGSIMRLGDLQRSAMAMLNVIKNSQPFELTLNKIIANSDDAELVADAKLALAILDGTAEPNETPDYNYDGLEDGSNVGASSDPGASAAREEANADISQWAATQGMVLLENNNNALPISGNAGTPVALFGVGAYNTIKGGTGSGDVYLKDG
ncbi:glycoside hydrolase family 3 N-terminal domain-containing protein, partial [Pseudoflavonifractor phocaeensis]